MESGWSGGWMAVWYGLKTTYKNFNLKIIVVWFCEQQKKGEKSLDARKKITHFLCLFVWYI